MHEYVVLLVELLVARLPAHLFLANQQKRMEQLMNYHVSSLNRAARCWVMEQEVIIYPQLKKALILLLRFHHTRIEHSEHPVSDDFGAFLLPFGSGGILTILRFGFNLILRNIAVRKRL